MMGCQLKLCVLSSPAKRERKGPNRKAIGEVRALCRQRALIYPILHRFASQDGPLSSPASQEKTLAVREKEQMIC